MTTTAPECPKCGAPTVRRPVTKGPRAGLEIWSCSRYPACSGLINIDPRPATPAAIDPSSTHPVSAAPGAYMQARFEHERERALVRRRALLPAFAVSAILLMVTAFFGLHPLGAPIAAVGAVVVGAFAAFGLWRLPFESLVWARGIEGERRTAEYLAPLEAEGFIVLNNRRVPSAKGDIDHVVIGPTGVFVIETKNWSGKTSILNGRLFVGDTERTWAVDQLYREATAVQIALGDEMTRRGVTVTAILCLVDGVSGGKGTIAGVHVTDGRSLASNLRGRPPLFTEDEVLALARTAHARLRQVYAWEADATR